MKIKRIGSFAPSKRFGGLVLVALLAAAAWLLFAGPRSASAVPLNDNFGSATLIASVPYTVSQNNAGATTEAGEPAPCGSIGATAWWKFTPTVDMNVTADTVGSAYDTVLAAYVGTSLSTLINLACNDNFSGLQSQVSFMARAGYTYQIQAGGNSGATGSLTLNVSGVATLGFPTLINYQGRLTDTGGNPVADASYSVAFRIFDASTGGTQLWTETQQVATSGGLFNVLLGANTALTPDIFSGETRFLEVQVGADPAMTPRQRLGTVPYAEVAATSGTTSLLGFSTTAVDTAGDVGSFGSSAAVGVDGLPVISYYGITNRDLNVLHCGNSACTAGNVISTVDSVGDVGAYNSITVGGDGLPVISYYDQTNGDLKVAHCGNTACNAGNTLINPAFVGNVGTWTSITIGRDSLAIISFRDETGGFLDVLHCGNLTCTAGNSLLTVDGSNSGSYSSITVGSDTLPVISYYNVGTADLKVAHCGNLLCTAGNTLTTVDFAGDKGQWSSIAIGVDGLPIISYYDATNSFLDITHCGNVACTAGNTGLAADGFSSGPHTSIAIGADGLAVVAYRALTGPVLKVVHCMNVACSVTQGYTVDSSADVGPWNALTIGTDGLPVIAYYDQTNGDLKVAHCSNRFCMPWHRPR